MRSQAVRFHEGDRVFVSPLHEEAPGWYALVLSDNGGKVMILPEQGGEPAREVFPYVLSLVRRDVDVTAMREFLAK